MKSTRSVPIRCEYTETREVNGQDQQIPRIKCVSCSEYFLRKAKHIPQDVQVLCSAYPETIKWRKADKINENSTNCQQRWEATFSYSAIVNGCDVVKREPIRKKTTPCNTEPDDITLTRYGDFLSEQDCLKSYCCEQWKSVIPNSPENNMHISCG